MVPGSSLLSDEEFFQFCQANKGLRIERNHKLEIIVMSPTGSESSHLNAELNADLVLWNRQNKSGVVFESNGGFTLPDRSVFAPDAAWVSNERWNALSREEQKKFAPVCPEFVMELKSPSDNWTDLERKAQSWIRNGCLMVWLIHPENKTVQIVTSLHSEEIDLSQQHLVSADPVLPGFIADLSFLLKS
jgi:Uma2 family endonuclease